MSEEKLDFPKTFLITANLLLLGWVFLAFLGAWFYNPVYGWFLLIFNGALIFLILRRLGCSSCYYCISCTSGFGRLAGVFFGMGYLKRGSVGNRKGLIGFIYLLLAPLPVVSLVFSGFEAFAVFKVLVLVCLLAVTAYSASTWLRRSS
ncbi:MAG: hypothetical protein NWF00_08600 [Candidatus Bathyarchaeota archaeon]|nr:hypothetical protein [Candidatus Bathyarchaeota archaeon]